MKKSNLLLLSALGVIILAIIIGMFFLRTNLYAEVIRGDGNIVEVKRDISSFEKIKVRGKYNVYYTQENANDLIVFADENLQELIRTEVINNELHIESLQPMRSGSDLRIELSNEFITHVETSASAGFFTTQPVTLPLLHLTASAGSTIDIEGVFESLFAYQNAGSELNLKGETNELLIESNAGGTVDASAMQAATARAEANAGAAIIVNAAEVEANANAGGNIKYLGDPVFKGMSTSSGGSISRY